MQKKGRREFLALLGSAAAASLTGAFWQTHAEEHSASPASGDGKDSPGRYAVKPWTGDDYSLGHRLRDGDIPDAPVASERKVDFVIVGGGMAGLTCGHHLRNEDFLLLEQYDHTGGTSSGGSYRGIAYSMGAVCTGSIDGLHKELFDQLKITPVKVPADQVAWHFDGGWLRGHSGSGSFFKELNGLREALSKAQRADLDKTTFKTFLASCDPKFASFMDHMGRSWFCLGAEELVATAGSGMLRALTTPSYVFDGGNSGIARALFASIESTGSARCKTSAFVWKVEPKKEGGSVVYSDGEGNLHRVDARHIVVATPPMITRRIVSGLPETFSKNLAKLTSGTVVVGNFCMRKKLFNNPYQSFADASYPFCQMILAETPYQMKGEYKPEMGSVLTAYYPFPSGAAGRARLLCEDREELAESLVGKLNQLIEGFDGALEEVVLTRWGHAFVVPRLGTAETLAAIKGVGPKWMTFAHSTAAGSQSLGGALEAAKHAADICLRQRVKSHST